MRAGAKAHLARRAVITALSLMSAVSASANGIVRYDMRVSDWRLTVEHDRFSDLTRCMIHGANHAWVKDRSIVRLMLPGRVNPSEVMVRVDDRPAERWRDLVPALAELGELPPVLGDFRALPVPAAMLRDAARVMVEPAFGQRPWSYRVRGLAPALDEARLRGCPEPFRELRR